MNKIMEADDNNPSKYSIEPHGDGYALYHGRDNQHHGMNLAKISDTDQETIHFIETALNFYSENFGNQLKLFGKLPE